MTPIGRRAACIRLGAITTAPLWPFWRVWADQDPPVDRRNVPFRSSVELVRLSVTARDPAGVIVHDLALEEFDVYEDGVRQQVEHFGHHETPISVVLLLDKSGSMFGEKMMHAVDGVINFVYAIAIEYDDDRSWLSRLSSDPLWRHLLGPGDIGSLRRLTDGTGGWTYPIQAAKRCKEVCLRVAEELRNQYLLAYYATNQQGDGGWRTIEVRASTGYVSQGDPGRRLLGGTCEP